MGEKVRLPIKDSLYSKGRRHYIDIICVGVTVTDLLYKAREKTPIIYITVNSCQPFFEGLQENLKYIALNIYSLNIYSLKYIA